MPQESSETEETGWIRTNVAATTDQRHLLHFRKRMNNQQSSLVPYNRAGWTVILRDEPNGQLVLYDTQRHELAVAPIHRPAVTSKSAGSDAVRLLMSHLALI